MTELCNGCLKCLYGHLEGKLENVMCAAPERIFRECQNPNPTCVRRYVEYMNGEIPRRG